MQLIKTKSQLVFPRRDASRYLCVWKKEEAKTEVSRAVFELVRSSKFQIANLLQQFPITSKERLELLPNLDKTHVNEGIYNLRCSSWLCDIQKLLILHYMVWGHLENNCSR